MQIEFKKYIREIQNWPKTGVNFKDITTALENKEIFQEIINQLCEPYNDKKIDKIVGIDARGFLLAGAMAYKLNTGLSVVRKKGKLPYKTKFKEYNLEYASAIIEMHEDTIKSQEKVIIVDDLIATGGTILATIDLVKEFAGEIVGVSVIIDLPFLGGSEKIKNKYNFNYLISYDCE